jgi:nucleotide-binding universal stress UspA family protein
MSGIASPVVVGVDGSVPAIRAAQWAAAVAEKFAAPLAIVHANPYLRHNLSDAADSIRAVEITEQRTLSEAILCAAEHAVRSDFTALQITTTQVDRSADEALRDLSEKARLIVLGCDDLTVGTALLVGSTTLTVATHSGCPVVVWRGDVHLPNAQRVVLGVDGPHNSGVAIASAFEFADRFGVGIIAVHTWSTRRPPDYVTIPYLVDWDAVEDAERRELMRILAPWCELYPDVDVTSIVEPDKPSRALLRHAKDAQLVVVGSRGRGLLTGAVLGSTGLNLLHHSAVPVMICRPSGVSG